jgi:hypothetical protein
MIHVVLDHLVVLWQLRLLLVEKFTFLEELTVLEVEEIQPVFVISTNLILVFPLPNLVHSNGFIRYYDLG